MRSVLFGGGFALLISLLGTRVAITWFTRWGWGQEIRDDGPTSHHTKRGTPTMGGLVIIFSVVVGYFAAKIITQSEPSASTPEVNDQLPERSEVVVPSEVTPSKTSTVLSASAVPVNVGVVSLV